MTMLVPTVAGERRQVYPSDECEFAVDDYRLLMMAVASSCSLI